MPVGHGGFSDRLSSAGFHEPLANLQALQSRSPGLATRATEGHGPAGQERLPALCSPGSFVLAYFKLLNITEFSKKLRSGHNILTS